MRAIWFSMIVAVGMSSVITSNAVAWKNIYNPACPTLNNKTDWKWYLTNRANIKSKRDSMVGVHLNKARKINDPAARGNLDPRMCYTVYFDYNAKKYVSYYTTPDNSASGPNTKSNLPGDPNKNEINVYGVLL